MNHSRAPRRPVNSDDDAARSLAHLRSVLRLIERMIGDPAPDGEHLPIDEISLDESARLAIAYAGATSITRRRFDALAGEAAAFAAAGQAALIRHRDRTGRDCASAAAHLAAEMQRSIGKMAGMLIRKN